MKSKSDLTTLVIRNAIKPEYQTSSATVSLNKIYEQELKDAQEELESNAQNHFDSQDIEREEEEAFAYEKSFKNNLVREIATNRLEAMTNQLRFVNGNSSK